MKKCRHTKQAALYSAGMMSKADRAWFKAHISECKECAALVSEDRKISGALKASADAVKVPAGLNERILQKLAEEPATIGKQPPVAAMPNVAFVRRILPAAACFALLLMAAAGFQMFGGGAETAVASSEYYYIATHLDDTERTLLMEGEDSVYEVLASVEY